MFVCVRGLVMEEQDELRQRAGVATRKALDGCLAEIREKHSRADAEVYVRNLVRCRAVYRKNCPHHSGAPAVEIQHLWVDPSFRRKGIASCVLWEIQMWFVSNGICIAGIYATRDFCCRAEGITELIESVGKGRMERCVRGIMGFTIE